MKNSSFKQIEKIIKRAKTILAATHQGPDADAISSLAALGLYLKSLNKKHYLLSVSGVPDSLKFIPNAKAIKSKHPKNKFDLVIAIDHGQKNRLGLDAYFEKHSEIPILVFDHHTKSNQGGDFGIIEPKYSATTEMLYDYFAAAKFKYGKDIARCLAIGILDDTGFFKYSDRAEPLKIIAALMKKFKIKPVEIDNALNGNVKMAALKLSSRIKNRAKYDVKNKFVYAWVKRAELVKNHLKVDELDNVVGELKNLKDGRFSLFLIEEIKGKIRGHLRSRPDKKFNVAELATKIGGGGHKYAAGFRFQGSIDSVLKLVAKYSKK